MTDTARTEIQSASADKSGDDSRSVDGVNQRIEALEKFIERRFDELSAEIHATSQQVDMAEEGIAKRFGEMNEVINAINHQGNKAQDNAGVELEAVVNKTEDAANRIIDAADNISAYLKREDDWANADKRAEMLEDISEEIQNIMLACEFQDLTSQRIHKALDHLNLIQQHLGSTAERLGIDVSRYQENDQPGDAMVDEEAKGQASQEDIDKMFE